MGKRPCGEVCPIGAASRRSGSTAEMMVALREAVGAMETVVCWGSGPARHVGGARTMLVCFCPEGGTPQRFCLDPEQALRLAHELLCGLLTHQREIRELMVLGVDVLGEGEGPDAAGPAAGPGPS